MKTNPLIIISGATATGKTNLSVELSLLAKERKGISCEIINFDSLLFYRDLNIGTAKPSFRERKEIPHHLIDICDLQEDMNAHRFINLAIPLIKNLHRRKVVPLLVGGSAFYIRALIKGMYESPPLTKEAKKRTHDILKERGICGIRQYLEKKDRESFESLHENDTYRNIRALEYFFSTGNPISLERKRLKENNPYDFSINNHPQWKIHHISLEIPKDEHWDIIYERTKKIISLGLIDEVDSLLKIYSPPYKKSLQSVGYKETIEFLASDPLPSKEDLIEKIFISTRKLSKAQKTFFKKVYPKKSYHPLKEKNLLIKEVLDFLDDFPLFTFSSIRNSK